MSSEITVRSSLQVKNGNLVYQGQPTQFLADMAGTRGPTPGSVVATTGGVDASLTELSALGGMCRIMNLDSTNFVTYGVWTGAAFMPLGELLPGESYVLRLSRYLLTSMVGTASIHTLRFIAHTASCNVLVEAFDP